MLKKVPYLNGFVTIDPEENIGRHIFNTGVYEPNLIRIVTECVGAGFDFVDVGANIGLHTLAAGFAATNLNQKRIAFEPEPTIFQQLQQNCADNQIEVEFHPIGISDKPGELTLYRTTNDNAGGHSFVHRENTAPSGAVEVKTLDAVLEEADRKRPTLIKIDVEGFEVQVLRGGRSWLSELENAVVLVEITPELEVENELLAELDEAGFSHRMIIDDTDTFDAVGYLLNDYFNLACWKGPQADQVMQRLIADLAIQRVPHNAADFVEWDRYSSVRLRPGQSRDHIEQSQRFTELSSRIEHLESQMGLAEFDFSYGVIGKIRQLWYSVGAKWGVRYVANQQEQVNREMLDLIKTQQAELERLHQIIDKS
ncbi:MAG: FkbM family methyltransferase [Anaerolineae bacterium]